MVPNERVLIIEDEPLVARSLSRGLRARYEVVIAVDGEDALALLGAGERFDLILCDLQMPNMTGIDFLMNLDPIAPEQVDRIVFLTAHPQHPMARLIHSNLILDKATDSDKVCEIVLERIALVA